MEGVSAWEKKRENTGDGRKKRIRLKIKFKNGSRRTQKHDQNIQSNPCMNPKTNE